MKRLSTASAVLFLALMATAARAQSTTGTISGRIVDAQGLAIPGATVTVTGSQGAKTTVTDTEGRFNLPFLTPGPYALRAELQGFKTAVVEAAHLIVDQKLRSDFTLAVGDLKETVEVTGVGATLLQT